ncbi:MAG: hypothetical protein WD406_08050 [Pseudohongiellaceae bacterium]
MDIRLLIGITTLILLALPGLLFGADASSSSGTQAARMNLSQFPTVAEQVNSNAPIARRLYVVPDDSIPARTPEIEARIRASSTQMRSSGYIDAETYEVEVIDLALENLEMFSALGNVTSGLSFVPVSIDGSFLDSAVALGSIAEGGFVNDKRTAVSRIFHLSDLGYIILSETDFMSQESRAVIRESHVNISVNGLPATHVLLKTLDGDVQSEFTWYSNDRAFHLITDYEISKGSLEFRDILEFGRLTAKELR